ncbi:hypothetical protein PWT90_04723 [Aphanocladium album]|nr:hypothetical protein PWT90_04723 [Aphanocladium album]
MKLTIIAFVAVAAAVDLCYGTLNGIMVCCDPGKEADKCPRPDKKLTYFALPAVPDDPADLADLWRICDEAGRLLPKCCSVIRPREASNCSMAEDVILPIN